MILVKYQYDDKGDAFITRGAIGKDSVDFVVETYNAKNVTVTAKIFGFLAETDD